MGRWRLAGTEWNRINRGHEIGVSQGISIIEIGVSQGISIIDLA